MCIIAYKPLGAKLPTLETITNCMTNNPDGTGYMFNTKEGVLIHKGFTKAQELKDALYKDLAIYNLKVKSTEIAIHARIATAGLVKPENCHPFPISENVGELQSTRILAKRAMVHNGIISISDDAFKNLSDTQIFVKNVLAKVDITSKPIKDLIKMSIGSSKMLVFSRFGMIQSYGTWEKEGNLWYSNTTYKERTYYYSGKYNSTTRGWEYWDDKYNLYYDRCAFCDSKLSKKNTAYVSDAAKFQLGLKDNDKLCDSCYSMCKVDSWLVD